MTRSPLQILHDMDAPDIDPSTHLDSMPTEAELREHDARTARHIKVVRDAISTIESLIRLEMAPLSTGVDHKQVRGVLFQSLNARAREHDHSKLRTPEREIFARVTPEIRGLTYGTEKYDESLQMLGPALEHHYWANRHHPEHFDNQIWDMNLIDVLEMLCDWFADQQRHDDGNVFQSLGENVCRFGLPARFACLASNTLYSLERPAKEPREKGGHPWSFLGVSARFCLFYERGAHGGHQALERTLSDRGGMVYAVLDNTVDDFDLPELST